MSNGLPVQLEITDDDNQLPCVNKLAFATKRQAQTAATVAGYQHATKLKVYLCRHCQLWHLASDFADS